MSTNDQFFLALQAYQEIKAELHQSEESLQVVSENFTPEPPTDQVAMLTGGSLLLGLAEDGLPLLLDLYDPAPGPLLVAGDGGSGKTAFLQSLAQASASQNPGEIQFGVLTPFPEEWTGLESLPNCMGIWPAYHLATSDFLSQMVSWADILPSSRQAVLVLFDGLDLLTSSNIKVQHDLRWLLMCGPERHVWPIVTVNPGRLTRLETWLNYFQTRILGRVKHPQTARLLAGDTKINLATLLPGTQFGLSRPEGWLIFRLPPVE
jgi:hypothetical protein